MFGLFKKPTFHDSGLGEFHRSRRRWRGSAVALGAPVPLVLIGSKTLPDREALNLARTLSPLISAATRDMEDALFEHYRAYAEADPGNTPRIASAGDVWSQVSPAFVFIGQLNGALAIEVGCFVSWDDEHTLGLRIQSGKFLELSGSVLAP